MSEGLIDGLERRILLGADVKIDVLVGGSGPPLLLLHGWPQTRLCWSAVAERLKGHFTLVIPDLRGYGRSGKPEGGPDHSAYSKRIMAQDQIAVMHALGFDRFAVGSHDRGARVAYRLALDHPKAVTRIASLDVVPTAEVWSGMKAKEAVGMWHWPFLAQPDGLPEKLIGSDPEWFVRYILNHQAATGFVFPEEHVADYVACALDPKTVRGWCEDYRAGWCLDWKIDEADRGRKIEAPLLMLWGESGSLKGKNGLDLWRPWANQVEGGELACGHFIPEEAPLAAADRFRQFFGAAA